MGGKKNVFPDSKRSWMILLTMTLSVSASSGLHMSFGTILGALLREFDESQSKTAWVGSLVSFFSSVLSPAAIFLAQRHGVHVTQFVGGAFLAIGAVTTSLMDSISYMYATYGVLIGISGALLYAPAIALIPELFVKHVSVATGIGSTGPMIGLIFFSFALPEIMDVLSWRKALWCVAAIGPLISLIGFTLPKTAVAPDSACKKVKQEEKEPWWKLVKKKSYLLLSISILLFSLVDFVPLYIVPICATESGMSPEQTKWFNIVYGFGSLIGRFISGPLAKPLLRRDQCKYLYLACLSVYSLSSFLVSLTIKFEYFMSYMILIGLLNGIMAGLFFLIILEVVGLTGYPTACGINIAICGVSYTTGPPLAGLLYESLNNVKYLLVTVSGTTLLAAIVMAMIPCVISRGTYMLHQSDYDFWRVYCHSPNISRRVPTQQKVFTLNETAAKCQAKENLGYEVDDVKVKAKTLTVSVSRTELLNSEQIA